MSKDLMRKWDPKFKKGSPLVLLFSLLSLIPPSLLRCKAGKDRERELYPLSLSLSGSHKTKANVQATYKG